MARSLPSWVVLDRFVFLNDDLVDVDESEWAILECARRKSYGCGVEGDALVEGLTLLARVADPPDLSALSIRVNDFVLRARGRRMCANVLTADKNLVILELCFIDPPCDGFGLPISNYYLIYDATDASLTMIPEVSISNPNLESLGLPLTPRPLPVHRADGSYALVIVATHMVFDGTEYCARNVLCLWPPSPASSSSSRATRWQLKEPIFPESLPLMGADEVFSFQGMALWADLSRGVLFCKHSALLSDDCNRVPFHFMDLPGGCLPDPTSDFIERFPSEWYRTMGCVGDSIKFVSHSADDNKGPEDFKMTIWTLKDLRGYWTKDGELRVGDLWEQQEFKRDRLPTCAPPVNPILNSRDDGVLYLVFSDYRPDVEKNVMRCHGQYVVRFDMLSERLLSSMLLPSWQHLFNPTLFGSDFSMYLSASGSSCHPAQGEVAAMITGSEVLRPIS